MDNVCTALFPVFRFAMVVCTVLAAGACLAQSEAWDPRAWSRYNGWEVTAFKMSGIPEEMVGDLQKGLEGRGQWKLLTGWRRSPFKSDALLDDLRRVRYYLARAGFPASHVHPVLVPDANARTLTITLEIDPGPVVRVAEVRHTGWPEGVESPAADDPLLMTAGSVFSDAAYEEMIVYLQRWIHDAGYALAEVHASLLVGNQEQVIIEVHIEAGDFYRIGAIEVGGCSEDLIPLVKRVMDIPLESEFEASRLEEAAADLRRTLLFRSVELTTEPLTPGRLRLRAKLADAHMRAWEASVGTWNDNPWLVSAGWSHRNFFDRGRGVGFMGTYGTHIQQVRAMYYWLGWLSPRARTNMAGDWIREDEDAYLSTEFRVEIIQSFRPRNNALSNVGVGLSKVDVITWSPDEEDIPDDQEWLLETWFDRKWDWTDDPMFPTRGGYFKIGLTYAPPGGPFKSSYSKTQADVAVYVPIDSRFTAAGRLRVGWSRPLGEASDLLANRRFYAGGYNSMRGYERRGLGPRDSANNPRGGQAVALAGLELRMRLVGIFDVAFFTDSGQVWRHPSEVALDEIAVAMGVDVGLRSPLGPVRVGHAWNIWGVPAGQSHNMWHFGIGYPW